MSSLSLIILVVGVIVILWGVGIYNSLMTLRNRTKEGWSDIDVQLKRRHDLIPNLVESVKGYLTHEKELLTSITQYRSQAISAQNAGDTASLAKAEGLLGSSLGKLTIAMEAYPDLKANGTVMKLMDELSDTENKIQAARRFYNGMARDLNTKIETVPSNIIAGLFKITTVSFFEVEDPKERENVMVNLK